MHRRTFAVLCFIAVVLCFLGSHRVALFDTDEPRYAQTAREMMQRGDWVLPTFNGEPRFAKPVLFYWLLIGAYQLFGVNEFAARFWSGTAAVAIALLLFLNLRRAFRNETAVIIVLCWLTAIGTQLFAHAAITDMVLTCFMTVAVLSLWQGFNEGKPPLLFVGATAVGLAVLTKGPIGVVLPLLIVGIASWLFRRRLLLRAIQNSGGSGEPLSEDFHRQPLHQTFPVLSRPMFPPLIGSLLFFAAIVLPWHVAITLRTEGEFLRQFLLTENIRRYAEGTNLPFIAHIAYYPFVLLFLAFPWSALGLWMLPPPRTEDTLQARWRILLSVWVLVPVAIFTFSRTKNPQYVLLSVPAMAALAGLWVTQASLKQERWGRRFWVGLSFVGVAFTVAIPFALNAVPTWHERWTMGEPISLGWGIWLMALLLMLLPFTALLPRRTMWIISAALMLVFHAIGMTALVPAISAYRQEPLKHFAQEAVKRLSSKDLLIVYRRDLSSVVFYSNRKVLRIDDALKIARLADGNRRVDVFTSVRFLKELLAIAPLFIVERQHGLVWLSNRPSRHSENS